MFRKILALLGLIFDPRENLEPPFKVLKAKEVELAPDNKDIVYTKGVPYERKEDNKSIVWEIIAGPLKGTQLKDEDIRELKRLGLKEDKARLIFEYWRGGRTAKEAAKELEGKKGFGLRTIEDYYSFLNKTSSPTKVEGRTAN